MAKKADKTDESATSVAEHELDGVEQPVASEGHDAPQAPPEEVPAPNPDTEAALTADDPTTPVPAGSADATADHTADGEHNGTENTHPQSASHQGDLSEDDKLALYDEFNSNGTSIAGIAEKYGVTPERVEEIVDDINGVDPEDRE